MTTLSDELGSSAEGADTQPVAETPVVAGHTPGPMRPLTAVEFSANAARRWREQYTHWQDADRFADGKTKGEQNDALNRVAHTPGNIAAILNDGWAYPVCNCCERRWPVVVELQSRWGEESRTFCAPCLDAALSLIDQMPDARAAIRKAQVTT